MKLSPDDIEMRTNSIRDLKSEDIELGQTVFRLLRSNVSSRVMYAQKSGRGSVLVISRASKKGKSAIDRICTGKL